MRQMKRDTVQNHRGMHVSNQDMGPYQIPTGFGVLFVQSIACLSPSMVYLAHVLQSYVAKARSLATQLYPIRRVHCLHSSHSFQSRLALRPSYRTNVPFPFSKLSSQSRERPFHPAFRIRLTNASGLDQPCSGITSGRYVAPIR